MRKKQLNDLRNTIKELKEMSINHYVKKRKIYDKNFIVIKIYFQFKKNTQVIEIIRDDECNDITARLFNINDCNRIIQFFDIKGD